MAYPYDCRYRIVRLMKVHDRSKLTDIDRVIEKNRGKEDVLIQNVVKKYGAEPAPEPFRERVIRMFNKYDPQRSAEVDAFVGKYEGREMECVSSLIGQYGPEPDPPTPRAGGGGDVPRSFAGGASPPPQPAPGGGGNWTPEMDQQRVRLTQFYAHYAPEKTPQDIENAVRKYSAVENGYDAMWNTLTHKYGPEMGGSGGAAATTSAYSPPPPQGGAPPAGATAGGDPNQHQVDRLRRFYAHYAPEKTEEQIVSAVRKYETQPGGFDAMWNTLTHKYGPELGGGPAGGVASPAGAQPATAVGAGAPPPATGAPSQSPPTNNAAQDAEMRDRIRRFYAKYSPEKTEADITTALTKYQGRYDEMWNILVHKYGPEPSPDDPAFGGSVGGAQQQQQQQQAAQHQQSSPSMGGTPGVSGGGEYGSMNAGPAIPPPSFDPSNSPPQNHPAPGGVPGAAGVGSLSQKERLTRYYAMYAPEKTDAEIDRALDKYSVAPGGYEAMWFTLEKKYGPEPPYDPSGRDADAFLPPPAWMTPADIQQRDRLKKYYAKYCPDKSQKDIDVALRRYSGAAGGYPAMWEALERKYGPEPLPPGAQSDRTAPGQMSQRDRLKRFYAKYAPNKTDAEIDTALLKYANAPGGYDKMWTTLEAKYGPEDPLPGTQQTMTPYKPIKLDLPSVKPPADLIDDAPSEAKTYATTRYPDRSTVYNNSSNPLSHDIAAYGATASVMRIVLKLFGAEFGYYERASTEKRSRFREAIEADCAYNMGISVKHVEVTRLSAGSINVEINVELPMGDEVQQIADSLVQQVHSGSFQVSGIRDAYRTELRANPIQLYAQSITVLGAANASAVAGLSRSVPQNDGASSVYGNNVSLYQQQQQQVLGSTAAGQRQQHNRSAAYDVPPVPYDSIPHPFHGTPQFGNPLHTTVRSSESRGRSTRLEEQQRYFQEHSPSPSRPWGAAPQGFAQPLQQQQPAKPQPTNSNFLSSLWDRDRVTSDALATQHNPYPATDPYALQQQAIGYGQPVRPPPSSPIPPFVANSRRDFGGTGHPADLGDGYGRGTVSPYAKRSPSPTNQELPPAFGVAPYSPPQQRQPPSASRMDPYMAQHMQATTRSSFAPLPSQQYSGFGLK